MDQVHHGSAQTMPAVRQALQASTESLAKLAVRYGLNEKTVANQLPVAASPDQAAKKNPKAYPIGYFHVDFTALRLADGKLYLFVAIDRTSKLAFAELRHRALLHAGGSHLDERASKAAQSHA